MAGGASPVRGGSIDATRVEAPVTFKTYLMCAFAAFGGIFFGYDSGYISGVLGMNYFISTFENLVCTLLCWLQGHLLIHRTGPSHYQRR